MEGSSNREAYELALKANEVTSIVGSHFHIYKNWFVLLITWRLLQIERYNNSTCLFANLKAWINFSPILSFNIFWIWLSNLRSFSKIISRFLTWERDDKYEQIFCLWLFGLIPKTKTFVYIFCDLLAFIQVARIYA